MANKNKPLYENLTSERKNLVQKVLDMKLKDMASQLVCLDYLMRNPNGPMMHKSDAYIIMSYADDLTVEMNKEANHIKLERAIERMEGYIVELKKLNKWDLVIKAEEMLNKLRGNYSTNINITGTMDQKVQTIRLNIPDDEGTSGNKGSKGTSTDGLEWFDSID